MVRIPGASQDKKACIFCFKENQGQDRLTPVSRCKKHKSALLMGSYFKGKKRLPSSADPAPRKRSKRICDHSGCETPVQYKEGGTRGRCVKHPKGPLRGGGYPLCDQLGCDSRVAYKEGGIRGRCKKHPKGPKGVEDIHSVTNQAVIYKRRHPRALLPTRRVSKMHQMQIHVCTESW